MKIRKLLVANRGEIAVRVFRTAKAAGIKTVAVYSDADANSMHTQIADEAVHIGGSMPSESYLRMDAILEACRQTGADAIHPGYGFLSERDEFSQACADSGIIFIGPPAKAMAKLGAKIDAKTLAVNNQVPITPGFFEPGATDAQLKEAADKIGYPIMLKASAGGGGRGMRIVRDPSTFDSECAIAKDEALKGFGDDAMMVEKLVENPRHIEVQFIADQHGQVACLFERECSIQRRHQKLVEEAPSAIASTSQPIKLDWEGMRDATARLVRAAEYFGAGTAEFMVDPVSGEFYFLEVNARLQVEHPVTEAITGLDLVLEQISRREGEPLSLIPDSSLETGPRSRGTPWKSESLPKIRPKTSCRVSANHRLGRASASGSPIRYRILERKRGHPVLRFDDREGDHSRSEPRGSSAKVDRGALGFSRSRHKTNIGFLLEVLRDPEFIAGNIDTGFIGRRFPHWQPPTPPQELGAIAEAASLTSAASGRAVRHRS